MKSLTQSVLIFTAFLCALLNGTVQLAFAQKHQRYEDAHAAVQTTLDDLDHVINQDPEHDTGQARARIVSARKSLSEFDRSLSNNKFNRRSLKSAMNNIRMVVNKNPVGAKERDGLLADLYNLSHLHSVSGK
jgi:ABC-type uncharacterized transport system YnjBCD ATPase subunit